jgi:mono/diheme cytochrome c family protein
VLVLAVTGLLVAAAPQLAVGQDPAGDVARGEEIYQATCAMCHGRDATGMMGMHPALTGVVDRLTMEGVSVTIRNGRDTRPPMPAFGDRLDDTDIADLLAYLEALPPGPRNFGPQTMDDRQPGMGGMMRDMMGGAPAVLWLIIVVLAATVAGLIGYLVGHRGRR